MTATEELRRMLDERGVEWRERVWGGKHSVVTFWNAREVRWHYRENRFGELRLHADGLIPEQAIDATLGRGMLTADDVRDLIEQHSDASGGNGRDFHNGAYAAIADELNATLWRGTCSVDGSTYWDEVAVWDYSLSCGCRFQWYDPEPPRYCPNCGRRVVAGDA